MRLALPAAAFLALFASIPSADAAGLSGMGLKLFGNYFHFGSTPNLPHPMVKTITAGPLRMTLQHTKLSQVKAAFGGTIQTQGENKTLVNWLCYHTDGGKSGQASNTWFISNILGGGEFIMIVAVEAASPGRVPADCIAAPKNFQAPNLGIPGLGASAADLRAKFGSASGGSNIAYRADVPGADALGTALNAQYIGYQMSGGQVAGYGAGETSVPAPPKSP